MFIRLARILALTVALTTSSLSLGAANAQGYPQNFEFGQPATESDIAPIDIAIPADGRGLPPGKGDHATGKQVYERACGACHGANLEGVANIPDMPSGGALRLIGGRGTLTQRRPVLTVESYWPYATTLFDYIRRAMPYTAPGSLTADEVYALSAFILAEAQIIDKSTVLDAATLPKVQMPNRNGFAPDPRPELFK
jgi:S-disulfanyl-L-cysteine oxidoreductase SoxD